MGDKKEIKKIEKKFEIKKFFSKKVIFLALVFLILSFIFFVLTKNFALNSKEEKEHLVLNVYNWGGLISDGSNGYLNINKEFEKETGIKINYTTYQDNESLYAKLIGSGTKYDIIVPSDYMIEKLRKKDMLQKLDFDLIPNYQYIDKEFKNLEHDPQNEYSVPYVWGVIGICYNKSMVDEPEEEIDWDILWNEKYKKNIMMFEGNARDTFLIALLKLGFSINTTKESELKAASTEVTKQRTLVKSYVSDQVFEKISNKEAALAPYYADAYVINSKNKDLKFKVPAKTNKFLNSICIPKNSEHPKEAIMYINFLCKPEIAAQNINSIGYATPESAARKLIESRFSQSEILYPSEEILENSEALKDLPQETDKLITGLWLKSKINQHNAKTKLVLTFAAFFIVYLIIKIYKNKNYLKDFFICKAQRL